MTEETFRIDVSDVVRPGVTEPRLVTDEEAQRMAQQPWLFGADVIERLLATRAALVEALELLPANGWEHIDTYGLPPGSTITTAVGSLSVDAIDRARRLLASLREGGGEQPKVCPACGSRFPGRMLGACRDDWHDPSGDAGGWSGTTLGCREGGGE